MSGLSITVDLGALVRNWRAVAAVAAPARCAAVVKADAYGTGVEGVVPALRAAGCDCFFVAVPEEGRAVRTHADDAAIYVLDGFLPASAPLYRDHRLRPVLSDPSELRAFADWRGMETAALHIDTGMNRLGLRPEEAALLSAEDIRSAGIDLVMSHLACADEPEHPLNEEQRRRFESVRGRFADVPSSLANSAGIFLGQAFTADLVRPGIALYGGASHPDARVEPVVTLEAEILQVRQSPEGETLGYGAGETLRRPSRIAVAAIGYADGYPRMLGSSDRLTGAEVFIAGCRAPLLGRVSMDLITIDVTDLPAGAVKRGDQVELFGPRLPVDEVARIGQTIAYELLTGLSRRAVRTYVGAA